MNSITDAFSQNSPIMIKIADAVVEKISTGIEMRFKKLEEEVQSLRSENKKLQTALEDRSDALEQYSRRNSIRIFGLAEKPNETVMDTVLQFFNGTLKLNLTAANIDRCHWLAKSQEGKFRLIIVKFISYTHKNLVMMNRKSLKGSTVVVTEDLTKARYTRLKAAQAKYGKKNVWTWDGRILVSTDQKRVLLGTDML